MSLALLCGAGVVLRAGRHGVRDARAGCLWLLDRVCSSVGATGVDLVARAACGWRRCQRRVPLSEVLDGRDNRPAVQWSASPMVSVDGTELRAPLRCRASRDAVERG